VDDYIAAFEEALSKTSTDYAPWYVIPANRNWMRNLAVSSILAETIDDLKPPIRRTGRPTHGSQGRVATCAMTGESWDCVAWLEDRRRSSDMVVEPRRLDDSTSWRLREGRLCHCTGGFFSVVSAAVEGRNAAGLSAKRQPLIDQPEVGLLGFIVRMARRLRARAAGAGQGRAGERRAGAAGTERAATRSNTCRSTEGDRRCTWAVHVADRVSWRRRCNPSRHALLANTTAT